MKCNHCNSENVKEVNVSFTGRNIVPVCQDCGKEVEPKKSPKRIYSSVDDNFDLEEITTDHPDWDYWLGFSYIKEELDEKCCGIPFVLKSQSPPFSGTSVFRLEDLDQLIAVCPPGFEICAYNCKGGPTNFLCYMRPKTNSLKIIR